MGDTDQLSRPLTDGLSVQVGDAVFRYNVVDMVTTGDHAGPGLSMQAIRACLEGQ